MQIGQDKFQRKLPITSIKKTLLDRANSVDVLENL
jgi:hypothetical protein